MNQKRFPEEFKIEAVRQIVERGHPVVEVSARLGVSTHSSMSLLNSSTRGRARLWASQHLQIHWRLKCCFDRLNARPRTLPSSKGEVRVHLTP